MANEKKKEYGKKSYEKRKKEMMNTKKKEYDKEHSKKYYKTKGDLYD